MDSVESATITSPPEQRHDLTPAVREMFSSALVEQAGYRAVGVGFVVMLFVTGVGIEIVKKVFGENQNAAGMMFLLGCVVGLVVFISERRSKIAEISKHDDQIVQALYGELKRRQATWSIIIAILAGAALIAVTIVVVNKTNLLDFLR